MKLMNAILFTPADLTILTDKVPIPEITDTRMVLVKVAYSGLCPTDLRVVTGESPHNCQHAIILGHEVSGTVVQVGNDVTNIKEGNRVIVDPIRSCKYCKYCLDGKPYFCQNGIRHSRGIVENGGWANYLVCHEDQIVLIPKKIPLDRACLAEPLSCVLHALEKIGPIDIGKKILILGGNFFALLFISILHYQGYKNVTVTESDYHHMETVKRLDTEYTLVYPDELKQYKMLRNWTFDVIIDTSGRQQVIEYASSMLNCGGCICIFGISFDKSTTCSLTPFDIFRRELRIVGTQTNTFCIPKAIKLMELMDDRYLNYENLDIQVFSLDQFLEAIDLIMKNKISKAIFKLT